MASHVATLLHPTPPCTLAHTHKPYAKPPQLQMAEWLYVGLPIEAKPLQGARSTKETHTILNMVKTAI